MPRSDLARLEWHLSAMADVPAVAALAEIAFEPFYCEAWTERQIADLLQSADAWLDLGLATTVGVLAFALCRQVADEVELLLCAAHPHWRQQGLGAQLMERVIAECRRRGARTLFLEVRSGNRAAIALYQRTGFIVRGRRPHYYRTMSGEMIDAITMSLVL